MLVLNFMKPSFEKNIVPVFKVFKRMEGKKSCIFCDIIAGSDREKIVFEDNITVVLNDIRPASKFHYLIIPKEHIDDVKSLNHTHLKLVEHMENVAQQMIAGAEQTINTSRMGFHWPPLRNILHLHFHVICPTKDMSFLGRLIFMENSFWFVSSEYIKNRLKGEQDHPPTTDPTSTPLPDSDSHNISSSTKGDNK